MKIEKKSLFLGFAIIISIQLIILFIFNPHGYDDVIDILHGDIVRQHSFFGFKWETQIEGDEYQSFIKENTGDFDEQLYIPYKSKMPYLFFLNDGIEVPSALDVLILEKRTLPGKTTKETFQDYQRFMIGKLRQGFDMRFLNRKYIKILRNIKD